MSSAKERSLNAGKRFPGGVVCLRCACYNTEVGRVGFSPRHLVVIFTVLLSGAADGAAKAPPAV